MDTILKVFPDARFVMTHRDPTQTLASICKMTISLRGTREAIASWRRDNPMGKRGENRYTLGQFGLDEAEVRELFSDYVAHFEIPTEAVGTARRFTAT